MLNTRAVALIIEPVSGCFAQFSVEFNIPSMEAYNDVKGGAFFKNPSHSVRRPLSGACLCHSASGRQMMT